jgi:hypothetical protein
VVDHSTTGIIGGFAGAIDESAAQVASVEGALRSFLNTLLMCFIIISGHARFALLAPQDPRWSHPSDRLRSDAYGVHRRRCCLRDNAMVLSLFVAVMDSFIIRKARGSFSAADVEPDV